MLTDLSLNFCIRHQFDFLSYGVALNQNLNLIEKVIEKLCASNQMPDPKREWSVSYIDKIIQMFISQLTYHLQSADHISSPWLKHYSRYLDDIFKMQNFSREHKSKKK